MLPDPQVVDLTARVPNKRTPRRMPVEAIVLHVMQGSLAGTDAWFENPHSDVSAHYGIGRGGEVHQYVADGDEAWHAGVVFRPTAPLVLGKGVGVNPNWYTVGVEHEGESGDPFTEEQYAASLWVLRRVVAAHKVPVDRNHLIGHHEINALHAGCPGDTFPWDRLLGDLRGG